MIGYVLTLFAVVAGAVAFPFSIISTFLVFIVVGAFLVLAIMVLLMTYLFFTITFYRRLMAFARRLLFGTGHDAKLLKISNPPLLKNDVTPERTDMGLWDRWIDGV